MLLTYKIKHKRDFSEELRKAQKVAEFCIKHRIRNRGLNLPPGQKTLCAFFSSGLSLPVSLDSSSSWSSPSFLPAVLSSPYSDSFTSSAPSTLSTSSSHSPQFSLSTLSSLSSLSSDSLDLQLSSLLLIPDSSSKSGSISASETGLKSDILTPDSVKYIGLKSTISGQILRKYSRNNELRSAKNVKLIIPRQAISVDREKQTLIIPCLKLLLNYSFPANFKKISQIEIDSMYAYVTVVFPDQTPEISEQYIGVDRNTKGHIAVIADPETGKVWKLGKMRYHLYKKYENIKKRLYNKNNFRKLKAVKRREKNIVKDLNHKISRKIVDIALYNGSGIKLENLKGIRKAEIRPRNKKKGKEIEDKIEDKVEKQRPNEARIGKTNKIPDAQIDKKGNKRNEDKKEEIKSFASNNLNKAEKCLWLYEYSLNSWSFNQLQQFIEYKARLRGIEVIYIDPHATSKKCSRCGHRGDRHSKHFKCPDCGHVDHADVNAAFNIALTPKGNGQFPVERDAGKGSSDTPQKILDRTFLNKKSSKKTSTHFAWEVCQFLT